MFLWMHYKTSISNTNIVNLKKIKIALHIDYKKVSWACLYAIFEKEPKSQM